jgi:hypothetical protein
VLNKNIEMPPENECIRVEGREDKKPIFKQNSTIGRYEKTMYVEDLKPYKIKRNKPDCSDKDFIYYCTSNWDSASEDDLDKMIALQLVSCPFSIAGPGGLGSITSKITGTGALGIRYISDLESTFKSIIPINFYSDHDLYRFSFLKGKSHSMKRSTKQFCELNYVKSCLNVDEALKAPKEISIQIPLLVHEAKLNKKLNDCQDLILQYQLTALTYQPKFEDQQLRIFDRNVKDILELKFKEDFLNVDPFTINKLALAFSRLYLSNEIESDRFKDATKLFFDQWEDWSDYLSGHKIEFQHRSVAMANDTKLNLTLKEQKVCGVLQRVHDETNELWIKSDELKEHMKDKNINLIQTLENLSSSAIIINKNNFEYVRLIDYS